MAGRSALLRSQGQETMRHLIWITASLVILTVQSGQINVSRAAANAITETLFALPLDAGNILEGATTLPPRTFSCGTNVCDANSSYCEMIKTDASRFPRRAFQIRQMVCPPAIVSPSSHDVLSAQNLCEMEFNISNAPASAAERETGIEFRSTAARPHQASPWPSSSRGRSRSLENNSEAGQLAHKSSATR